MARPIDEQPFMTSNDNVSPSRREFLKTSAKATVGGVAAVTGLTSIGIPAVHAAGSDLIQVAFVGCGGRGGGAAVQALSTNNQGPIKIVAMADAFDDRLQASYKGLAGHPEVGKLVDVPKERQFVGWDAYK